MSTGLRCPACKAINPVDDFDEVDLVKCIFCEEQLLDSYLRDHIAAEHGDEAIAMFMNDHADEFRS